MAETYAVAMLLELEVDLGPNDDIEATQMWILIT
jgi:hypothetical protein